MYIVEVIFAMIGIIVAGAGVATALSAGLLALFDFMLRRQSLLSRCGRETRVGHKNA